MKIRTVYTLFFTGLALVFFLSNKSGRAAGGMRGSTGAPGDEVVSNQLRTCQNCHAGGNFQFTATVDLLAADSSKVTAFAPGTEYTARVKVNKLGGAPTRFGFQMIAVQKSDNAEYKGFSAPSANTKLTTLTSGPQTGRTYAEHKTASADSVFWMKWTAPANGAAIDFYFAAVAANNNSQSGGDAGFKSTFSIAAQTISTDAPGLEKAELRAMRDVASDRFFVEAKNIEPGERLFEAFDSAGRLIFSKKSQVSASDGAFEIDAKSWQSGLFVLKMSQKGRLEATCKLLKI